jgi:DEAD/DEAH box helicase domain-containing protein
MSFPRLDGVCSVHISDEGLEIIYYILVMVNWSSIILIQIHAPFVFQALAQDQLRTLIKLKNASHIDVDVKIYDGDTPREDRLWIRDNARLVTMSRAIDFCFLFDFFILTFLHNVCSQLITNPDMLHVSILPYHGQFQRILSNLR